MKGFEIKVIGMPKQKGPHPKDNLVLVYEYDQKAIPINKQKPACKSILTKLFTIIDTKMDFKFLL